MSSFSSHHWIAVTAPLLATTAAAITASSTTAAAATTTATKTQAGTAPVISQQDAHRSGRGGGVDLPGKRLRGQQQQLRPGNVDDAADHVFDFDVLVTGTYSYITINSCIRGKLLQYIGGVTGSSGGIIAATLISRAIMRQESVL